MINNNSSLASIDYTGANSFQLTQPLFIPAINMKIHEVDSSENES